MSTIGVAGGSGSASLAAATVPPPNPACAPGSAASAWAVSRRPGAAVFVAHGSCSGFGSDSHFAAFGPCDSLTANESVYPDPSGGPAGAGLTPISGACAGGLPHLRRASAAHPRLSQDIGTRPAPHPAGTPAPRGLRTALKRGSRVGSCRTVVYRFGDLLFRHCEGQPHVGPTLRGPEALGAEQGPTRNCELGGAWDQEAAAPGVGWGGVEPAWAWPTGRGQRKACPGSEVSPTAGSGADRSRGPGMGAGMETEKP